MTGKVVGIMGHTRSGKTHLAQLLASHYRAPVLLEDDGVDFPERIQVAIRDGSHALERFLYFRNKSVAMHLEGKRLAEKHRLVFIDAVWMSSMPYIHACGADDFEKEQLRNLCTLDLETLSWPDIVIVLTEDDATARDLWKKSGRNFEISPDYFAAKLLPIKVAFEDFVSQLSIPVPSIRTDRSGLDFDSPAELKTIIDQIDAIG